MSVPRLTRPARGPFVARTTLGWQTMLADLSLILFMVSAAAMADGADKAPASPKPAPAATPSAPAESEPIALWRDAPGAPGLALWLAQQQRDVRQQLTITLRYRPQDQAAALARGGALAGAAMQARAGLPPRIILEPVGKTRGIEAVAALAYDRAP